MTVAKIPQRCQCVARASAARPGHPTPAVAGVLVEMKRIGQAIDLTRFIDNYLIPDTWPLPEKNAPLSLFTLPASR
jgi:hypothetical protein